MDCSGDIDCRAGGIRSCLRRVSAARYYVEPEPDCYNPQAYGEPYPDSDPDHAVTLSIADADKDIAYAQSFPVAIGVTVPIPIADTHIGWHSSDTALT